MSDSLNSEEGSYDGNSLPAESIVSDEESHVDNEPADETFVRDSDSEDVTLLNELQVLNERKIH